MNRQSLLLVTILSLATSVLSGCDLFDHGHDEKDHSHNGQHSDHHDTHSAGDDHHSHSEKDHGHNDQHSGHDDHSAGDDHHGHGDSDEPSVAVTHFNDLTELFVEFPVFSVGNESPFAAHLTWLKTFRPVADGRVRVILRGGGNPEEEFTVDEPSIPGIFRPVAVPAHAGEREVLVILDTEIKQSIHNLGSYTVYATKDEIPVVEEEDDSGVISYLKEQQWQVEFATTLATPRTLRESIRAVATVRAAADGEAEISSPHDGQLSLSGKSFPTIGSKVNKGQVLAVVGSQIGRELQTGGKGFSGTALRAPIDGVIDHVHATEGAYLSKGQPVFHIINPEKLWLENHISETDVMRIKEVSGAWVILPNVEEPFYISTSGSSANGKLVAFSQTIDSKTRTAPLTLEFQNTDQQLRIGMLLQSHVLTGKTVDSIAVPMSAIVHDNGVPVVYVELGGESFERRIVQTGIRDGDYIEVRSGVSSGERVVSKGAYLVKLAASGPAEAGHGHAH